MTLFYSKAPLSYKIALVASLLTMAGCYLFTLYHLFTGHWVRLGVWTFLELLTVWVLTNGLDMGLLDPEKDV